MDERDKEIIITLADRDMKVSETARVMFMHRNAIIYHIQKVKRITGLNPLNFYDLQKLVNMVKKESRNKNEN